MKTEYEYKREPKKRMPKPQWFNRQGLKGWELFSTYCQSGFVFHLRKKLNPQSGR